MSVCLAYPNSSLTYSETFIKNHLLHIPAGFTLTGGQWPYLTADHKSIFQFPLNENILRASIKRISPGFYHRYYTAALKKYLIENGIKALLAEYGPVGARMVDGCLDSKVSLTVHFHGYDAYHNETLARYRIPYKHLFENVSKIIVVSEDMKTQLISIGAAEKKIVKIPYGVNTELFKGADPGKNEINFLSVGRFAEKKAPDKTILAFRNMCKKIKEARLFMIGDGEMLADCKELVKKLNIEKHVIFLGVLSPEEISAWHKKSYCFIQHSMRSSTGDSEGLPNTILEALSSGLPVISTRHAGIAEVIQNGENGFLVEEGDTDGMALFMERLAGDKNLVATMSKNARATILENYNLSDQIGKIIHLLEE